MPFSIFSIFSINIKAIEAPETPRDLSQPDSRAAPRVAPPETSAPAPP